MLEELKMQVFEANMDLPRYGLVTFTWGNVSGIDESRTYVVIKPSGVPYEILKPENMAVIDLKGNQVEGTYKPSSDTPSHLELYRACPGIGGIVHTHSTWATGWAQAGRGIPCYGTTHADYMFGEIPCLECLPVEEVTGNYEQNIGLQMAAQFEKEKCLDIPAVLLRNHGPFVWGKDPQEAVHNAVVLEELAKLAALTELINPKAKTAPVSYQNKHYFRKHGANSYYGQIKR